MAGNKIKGIILEIAGDTTSLNKALSSTNTHSKNLQAELKQIERLLRLDPSNTELLAQRQKLLAESVENTSKKLGTLKEAEKQVQEQFKQGKISEEQYRALQREVVKTEQELKKLESAASNTSKRLSEIGKSIQDVGDKMSSAGKNLSMKVTAPIVGLGTVSAKAAIDFESAFAGVRKTVDATEEEFDTLEKGIRDMAKEIPAAATEIAGVGEAAGQLGIETENILGFTRTMIDLGEATNLSADDAATALARLANITQMPQDQFNQLGSTIVALGNNLATTESEIVNMGLRLAGAGKQVGMSEAEILSFAGALSSVGIESEAGGSAFSKVMVNMQLAAEKGGKSLDDFANVAGMTSSKFQQAFKDDAAGAIIEFIKGLSTAEERGLSTIKVLDDMGITEVRLRDSLLRAAGASGVFNDAITTGTEAWKENTALTDEAEQRYKTTASQLEILRNVVVDIAMQFGEILLPPLLKAGQAIKRFADSLGEISPAMKKVIVIIAAIIAAIGPLLIILGLIASGIGSIISVAGMATGALSAMGVGVSGLATPIGIAVAAVIGLIAIIADLWKNNEEFRNNIVALWTEFTATLRYLWDIFGDDIKAVTKAVFDVVQKIIGTFIEIASNIIQAFLKLLRGDWKGAWDSMLAALKGFVKGVPAIIESLIKLIRTVFGSLAKDMFQIGKNIVQGLWDGITGMATWLQNKISGFVGGIVGKVKGVLGIASPSKVFADIGENMSLGIVEGIESAKSVVGDAMTSIVKPQFDVGMAVSGGGTVRNSFNIQSMSVRNDQDIHLVAKELYNLQQQRARGRGTR